jgi:acyl-CoA synthetase (NDP forming)
VTGDATEPVPAAPLRPASGSGHPLDAVFAPRSVVVVGASGDPTKRGYQILRALSESGYGGGVYAVNPKGGTILGHEVHPSIADLPVAPDLAVVCTPGATAPDVVAACGSRGIRAAIVLAVGFRESGPEGETLEARLREAALAHGVRLVGPNTSGLLNLPLGLNLIGARGVRTGALSLLVQSGNMALSLMNEATRDSRAGVCICAGLGNEADVGFGDSLEYLGTHAGTRAVIVHVEGFRDGRSFLASAAKVARKKPVVLIKAARSTAGQDAARSHTGAVAGPYDRLSAGLAQAGVVEMGRTDELLQVATTLAWQPPAPPGTGVAVLSDGGGQGTLAVDVFSESGTPLARLHEETRRALRNLLGPAASTANPVDLAGAADADPRRFADALSLLLADSGVGCVLLVGLFGGYGIRFAESLTEREVEAATRMTGEALEAKKGLVVHSMYAAYWSDPLERLARGHVPVVASLNVACRCASEIIRRGEVLASPPWRPREESARGRAPDAVGPSHPVLVAAREANLSALNEPDAHTLLEAVGVTFPRTVFCHTRQEAMDAVAAVGGPTALKVVSRDILHKSDAGGIVLGVEGVDAAGVAWDEMMRRCRAWLDERGARGGRESRAGRAGVIEGILVSPMHPPPLAELLVGAVRDPDVGPVLTLGAGGVWVEVMEEVVHRVLPVGDDAIREMLSGLWVARILQGGRGRPAGDLDAVLGAARAVARCILQFDEVAEVEVNPLFVYPRGVVPVDARVYLTGGAQT